MMEESILFSLIGWIGVLLIVIAYILFFTKKLKINYVLYHLLNFFGSLGLIISTFLTECWPALTLFFIFAGISIAYIVKILKTKPDYKDLRN